MIKILARILLALGSAAVAWAQSPTTAKDDLAPIAAPIDFANTSAARVTLLEPLHLAQPRSASLIAVDAASSTADPAAPKPKFVFGGRDDFRWQLGLGIAWNRFRSSIFDASAVGLNTSL